MIGQVEGGVAQRAQEQTVLPGRFQERSAAAAAGFRTAFRGPIPVYIAAHLIVVLMLLRSTAHQGVQDALTPFSDWDGGWYQNVAQNGYEQHLLFDLQGHPQQMRITFFPLLPLLMRAVSAVLGIGPAGAGVLVSAIAALAAAAGIHAVLRPYLGERGALSSVALWATLPTAFIQSAVYTESLFTAFAAWALFAVHRKHWLAAALLTVGAGLSRSTAVVLIAVVCLAAGIEAVRRTSWRAAAAVVIAPLGFVGYLVFLWNRFGRADAWFLSEKAPGWDNSFDWGRSTWDTLTGVFGFDGVHDPHFFGTALAAVFLMGGVVAGIFVVRQAELPWWLIAWSALSVAFIVLQAGTFTSKARYIMPAFPLVAPAAALLRGSRLTSLVILVAALGLLGGWYGAYVMGPLNDMAP